MNTINKTVLAIFTTFLATSCFANSWGYSGGSGPEHWSDMDSSFSTCGSGVNQSPINLTRMVETNLTPLKLNYQAGGNQIINNGHSIQINYASGSTLSLDGDTYSLKQFHFHAPSENRIEGESFPMEAHFVHADKEGHLAVIAVMFKVGQENLELEKAWKSMPNKPQEKQTLTDEVNAASLLPKSHDYYRFNGSLTTPPCSEGVKWFVMKNYETVSSEQISKFTKIMAHPNNRPIQSINARAVMQ